MADDTAKPGEINGDPIDRFTLAHLGVGTAMGIGGAPWWLVIVGAVGWELVERPLKRAIPAAFPHASQDTPKNAGVDALAVVLGAAIGKAWRRHAGLPR